jgi:DNA gyrase/topoisomerase IV subunit A
LLERIKDLLDILAREARVFAIIKTSCALSRKKYATPRLTELAPDEGEIAIEDLIANEGVIITITHSRPDQAHQRQFLPRPAPRRQGRHRHGHARNLRRARARWMISSSIFSPPARTIT